MDPKDTSITVVWTWHEQRAKDAEIAALRAEVEALRSAIESANQRLNESGTGQMGLIDTIHATASILRAALGAA